MEGDTELSCALAPDKATVDVENDLRGSSHDSTDATRLYPPPAQLETGVEYGRWMYPRGKPLVESCVTWHNMTQISKWWQKYL